LMVGVPATVEHSAEAGEGGEELGKWVAETTQVSSCSTPTKTDVDLSCLPSPSSPSWTLLS
jgi:hypothetical protein